VSPELAAHRGELLAEEAAEVAEVAVGAPLDRLAHELADVVYVAYGTALVHGIDLDAVIAEIHRSNMTKLGPDGQVARRADGKVLKGDHYRAPDVAQVLRRQGWSGPGA
jgi:predicted HAD superfamily Cof-like phosphohydrolase